MTKPLKTPKPGELEGMSVWKEDIEMPDPKPYDIVIPIIGITGSGKSTFINSLTNDAAGLLVDDGIDPCTRVVKHIAIPHPKDSTQRIVFLDTPGLDSTVCPDSKILERIVSWLEKSYTEGTKLAGIIFLYEISHSRDLSLARANLDEFDKLCDKRATKNIILATTKWTTPPTTKELNRESQLQGPDHWGQLIRHGSRMGRLSDTSFDSAWMLVNLILADAFTFDTERIHVDVEQMKESLKKKKDGQRLITTLEELLVSQNTMALELKRGDGGSDDLWNKLVDNDRRIRDTLRQIGTKVPLSKRIRSFFKF